MLSSVQNLETEVQDLRSKLGMHLSHLPRYARWEAELLALDSLENHLPAIATNVVRELDRQRDALLAGADLQRSNVMAAVREERAGIVASVEKERVALLAESERLLNRSLDRVDTSLRKLQQETLTSVQTQRVETLEAIRQERVATTAEVERIANAAVDRALGPVWKLLIVAWLGLAALILFARFVLRSPKSSAG